MIQETKSIDCTKQREGAIIKEIRSHSEINHNGLKRLTVPRYMATKTFDRTIKNLIERKIINVENVGNQKHYTLALDFPDSSVRKHITELSQLLGEMKNRLKELKDTYPRFSRNKKERMALDLSHMYYDTRLQVVKIFEILGKERPVVLGEYDSL